MNNLINKYDKPGPRYTSFPPVPFWDGAPSEAMWFKHVKRTYNESEGIDLYIHIPYCESLCYYCGCHRTITKNKSRGDLYAEYIIKEWQLYKSKLGALKIHSIHFGGGTPTFLSPNIFERLLTVLSESLHKNFLGSIEIDPRTCEEDHLKVLKEYGFKRISMGIQDFDEKVQSSINRHQSVEMIEQLVRKVKEHDFNSINFDLIYGLPNQTRESITRTINEVQNLKPDLIAFYSYAHLPERLKNQKLIKEDELPTGPEKRELYELGKKLLIENGYVEIGLDHFAKPDNFLGKAYKNKKLKRSFMGYTDDKTDNLIALGVSSISNSQDSFIQNEKDIKKYMAIIDRGELPIVKGHIMSNDDQVSSKIIHDLMCNGSASLKEIQGSKYYRKVLMELEQMQADNLLTIKKENIEISDVGHPFIRNIAMIFDFYIREKKSKAKFSQTI